MTLWTPVNLAAAPALWLKADALALSDGATVTSWTDSSGNAAHATVPSFAAGPTFETNELNSLPIVRFTVAGTQQLRSSPSTTTPYSIIVMARDVSATTERIISGAGDTSTNWLLGWWGGFHHEHYINGWVWQGHSAPNSIWYMFEGTGDGSTVQFYEYGTLIASNALGIGSIGGKVNLAGANENTALEKSDCEIAEVVVCNSVLSATERQLVEGYMAWKWGNQGYLSGGHPYAGAAPTIDGPLAGVNFIRKGDRRS